MLRSFYVALTGLTASKEWLDITSNNIANANTIGFKKSRPVFQDIVLQNIFSFNHYSNTVSKVTFGGGVYVPTTLIDFSEGALKFTGRNTDIAIDGDGFFILGNENGARFYSRNGELRMAQGKDENGRAVIQLVHSSGLKLLADKIDSQTLQPTGKLEPVTLQVELPPKATQTIYATDGSNLDPRSKVITTAFDPEDATTYNIMYTVTVYDKGGNAYDVNLFFKKVDSNKWRMFVLLHDKDDMDGDSQKWEDLLNTGTTDGGYNYQEVTFNVDGTLNVPNEVNLSLTNLGTAADRFDLKKVTLSGITQYPVDFALGFQQDGYPPGLLQTVSIGEDGTITGVYSNGQSLPLYRMKLAYFSSPQDLVNKGGNVFIAPSTLNPVEQYAGPRSKVRSGTLELSNVDVAEELINMITAEKAYQANAKVIQTGQTILDTTIQLKR